jgi:alpha-tubulin suppressor-like RCC1 family protein
MNDCGQLGIGNNEDQFKFIPVDFFSKIKILKISCGSDHTFIQCSKTKIIIHF